MPKPTLSRTKKNKPAPPPDKAANAVEDEAQNSAKSENAPAEDSITTYILSKKRKKFNELHKQCTFWLENEVYEKLHSISKQEKGLKTLIVNDALKLFLDKYKI